VRLEGLGQLKNPMTSSEIEPAIFRFVAQCLNQLRYHVPRPSSANSLIKVEILTLHVSAPLADCIRRYSQHYKGTASCMLLFEHRLLL
jgi:hypothetical protein